MHKIKFKGENKRFIAKICKYTNQMKMEIHMFMNKIKNGLTVLKPMETIG